MAIPVRVSIQILLVIFLCRIEAVQRLAFHDNGLVKPGLQLLQRTPGNSQIRVIHGINARPILRALVKPLFVERSRINDVVKQLQQCFQRKLLTLPGDFACLNPAQRAAVKILTKYNAAHWLGQSEKIKLSGCMKRKDPPFRAGLFFSWNPATSYSPRSSPTKYHRR